MNAVLLKNPEGILGLAVVNDMRKIRNILFMSIENRLHVMFVNGEEEPLDTDLDGKFIQALYRRKDIFIGHFSGNDVTQDPADEYFVPIGL